MTTAGEFFWNHLNRTCLIRSLDSNTNATMRKTKELSREIFNPNNTIPTVEHDVGSVMLWACFAASGADVLLKIKGLNKKKDYLQFFQDNLELSDRRLGFGHSWVFQQVNDLKHTLKVVQGWLNYWQNGEGTFRQILASHCV